MNFPACNYRSSASLKTVLNKPIDPTPSVWGIQERLPRTSDQLDIIPVAIEFLPLDGFGKIRSVLKTRKR
jgi:hypothetical protein